MLSSEKNIDTISQLISELLNYIQLRIKLFKVDSISIASKLLAAFVLGGILFIFAALAIMLISMMCVTILSNITGSETLAYALVIIAYILLSAIIYRNRTKWIERPITHFLVKLLLTDEKEGKEK